MIGRFGGKRGRVEECHGDFRYKNIFSCISSPHLQFLKLMKLLDWVIICFADEFFRLGEVIGAEDNRTTPPLPLPAGIVKSEYLAARFGTKAPPPPETNWNGIDSRAGNGKRRRKYHSNRNNDFENDAPPFTAIKPSSHSDRPRTGGHHKSNVC